MFSKEELKTLEIRIADFMSEKRYLHTLGVRKMAKKLAMSFYSSGVDFAEAAALLHDISKEMPLHDHLKVLEEGNFQFCPSDYVTEGILHAYTAPQVVKTYFPQFAKPEILNAVLHHTLGAPDMNILDEIIFLADYIEEGRKYERCVTLRKKVIDVLNNTTFITEKMLHEFVIDAIDSMISYFIQEKKEIHEKTILTRNALLSKIQ